MFPISFLENCILFTVLFLLPLFGYPFSFEISNFTADGENMFYEGDAITQNGTIQLVSSRDWECRVGHASYADPVRLWDSSSGKVSDFTTHFSFTIYTNNNSFCCDGFAFYISRHDYLIPANSAGGYLGLFNSTMTRNQILIVEFDTYSNEWDPPVTHIGINDGTLISDVYVDWDTASIDGKEAYVWVSYSATTRNLDVFLTYEKNPVSPGNSTLSYTIDMKESLPEWVRIGFSSSTAHVFQRSTISLWKFTSNLDSTLITGTKHGKMKIIALEVGSVSFLLLMLSGGIMYFLVRRKQSIKNAHASAGNLLKDDLEKGAFPKRFCYRELEMATNGFADHMRLGQGGSGRVYRGMLNKIGRLVAVKRIFPESFNAEKIFVNEVKIISRLIQRNLVQLIGWCHEQGNFLLVYDYMPNGSLDTHLFGNQRTLSWKLRYKIAIDLASGIHYLHEDAEQCVLHRDIKSANVLLDTDFNAKLGDFGAAKLVDSRLRTQMTGVVGTFGYLAPEYVNEGRASKESDMFSFGIVALELACGRRTFQDGDYHMPLAKWVWQLYLSGNILNAADEGLNLDFDREQMECLLKVGLWCAHPKDKERPKAGQVIKILQLEMPVPDLPNDAHDSTTVPAPSQQFQNDSLNQSLLCSSCQGTIQSKSLSY